MHMRRLIVVNVLVAVLLMAAGCRAPWSKKKSAAGGDAAGLGLNDPTLLESTDIPQLTDEFGHTLGAGQARFEDVLQPVAGVAFSPVYFAFDSYSLAPAELAKIELVAQHLTQNHDHVLVVEGHCDERGSNEYNLSLGENRAISIRSRLISLGVADDRIQSRSYGEEKPAVAGSGEAVWSLNRRGEFALFQR